MVPWTQTGVEDEDEEDEKEGDDGDALLAEQAREVTQAADLKGGEHGAHRGLRVVLLMEDDHLEVAEGTTLGRAWEGEGDPETDEEPDLDLRVGLHELRLVLTPVLVADLKQRLFHSRLRGLLWCDLGGNNMPIIVIGAPLEA